MQLKSCNFSFFIYFFFISFIISYFIRCKLSCLVHSLFFTFPSSPKHDILSAPLSLSIYSQSSNICIRCYSGYFPICGTGIKVIILNMNNEYLHYIAEGAYINAIAMLNPYNGHDVSTTVNRSFLSFFLFLTYRHKITRRTGGRGKEKRH